MAQELCVVGVGSPHGDDRLGWEVVEWLRREEWPGVRAMALATPSHLLDHLSAGSAVVVIDALPPGQEPGRIHRFAWPVEVVTERFASSHGFDVVEALRLAECLGRLPATVVILGMEAGQCEPGEGLSPMVQKALPALMERLKAEVICLGKRGE